MAKAPAKPEPVVEAPAAPKKSNKLLLIVVILLLVLLIAVVGLGALIVLAKNKGSGADAHANAAPAAAPAASAAPVAAPVDLTKPPAFVTLEPFTVNLRPDEGDRYLQAVIVLRVADTKTADSLKGFMPEIRHRVNLLLSSKLPSELATMEGREVLAIEVLDESNDALGFPPPREANRRAPPSGPIQAVLFNSFIIQ